MSAFADAIDEVAEATRVLSKMKLDWTNMEIVQTRYRGDPQRLAGFAKLAHDGLRAARLLKALSKLARTAPEIADMLEVEL